MTRTLPPNYSEFIRQLGRPWQRGLQPEFDLWPEWGFTPAYIAAAFRDAELNDSWGMQAAIIQSAIIHVTKGHEALRSEITAEDIKLGFDDNITSGENFVGGETGFQPNGYNAGKILSGINDDARFAALVTPDYVKRVFKRALANTDGLTTEKALIRAAVVLEATLNAPNYRAVFEPQDITQLFSDTIQSETYAPWRIGFRTTEAPQHHWLRSDMKPELYAAMFATCIKRLDPKKRWHAHMALQILGNTVGLEEKRRTIPPEQIEALRKHHRAIIAVPPDRSGKSLDAELAEEALKQIDYCFLAPDAVPPLLAHYKAAAKKTGYRFPHELVALGILGRYPVSAAAPA